MAHRYHRGGGAGAGAEEELDASFDALFVSGSPRPESGLSLGSSPAGSPARSAAVAEDEADDSPPCSPRPTLARVCSGVMDIPAAADADEQALRLVGPSALPAVTAGAAQPDTEEAAEPRKLEPNDFTILSLVGQGAFGKVRAPGRSQQGTLLKKCGAGFSGAGALSRRSRAGHEGDAQGACGGEEPG